MKKSILVLLSIALLTGCKKGPSKESCDHFYDDRIKSYQRTVDETMYMLEHGGMEYSDGIDRINTAADQTNTAAVTGYYADCCCWTNIPHVY